jgi:hypothetical protein
VVHPTCFAARLAAVARPGGRPRLGPPLPASASGGGRQWPTCGRCRPTAGATSSTPLQFRPAPGVGRRFCSDRRTPLTPSPSTSHRGVAMAAGAVGARLRPVLLVSVVTPGVDGCRHSGRRLRRRPAFFHTRRRPARRSRGRAITGGGADVPVRQPGRAPGSAHGYRRLLRPARYGGGPAALVHRHRSCRRIRLSHQAAPSLSHRTRTVTGVPAGRSGQHVETATRNADRRRRRCLGGGMVGRARPAVAEGLTPVYRRQQAQQFPGVDVRLQRPRPDHR